MGESILSARAVSDRSFARRMIIALGLVLLAAVFAYLLRYVAHVLLLGFAGILLAVALDGLAKLIERHTPLKHGWSLVVVLVALIVLAGAIGGLFGPYIVDQLTQLFQRLPQSLDTIRTRLQAYEWGRLLLQNVPEPDQLLSSVSNVMGRITGAFSTVLGALGSVFVIIVVGIYIAISPSIYCESAVYLVPPKKRGRAHEVFAALGQALRRWLAGRLASMVIIGVLTYIGLSIVGVPLSLALGFITGILCFVPYLGPLLALIPIVLVALLESPTLALYTLPVYGGIQFAESYLVTPLVEERAVAIPPAYLIIVQMLGGVLAGTIGVLLSAPLAVVLAVIVQMLYVEDVLGDSVQVLGES